MAVLMAVSVEDGLESLSLPALLSNRRRNLTRGGFSDYSHHWPRGFAAVAIGAPRREPGVCGTRRNRSGRPVGGNPLMSEQLNLFQPADLPAAPEESLPPLAEEIGALDELFRSNPRWRCRKDFFDLLRFLARFPQYSPFNGFLIYLQRPDASRVATARAWRQTLRRRPRPGARPILILAPMAPVIFLFDVKDTEGDPAAAACLPAADTHRDRLPARVLEHTLHNCEIQRIAVRESQALEPAAERAVRLTAAARKAHSERNLEAVHRYLILVDSGRTPEEKYGSLALELGRIFCGHLGADADAGWPDRADTAPEQAAIEAEAAAFLVRRRRGLGQLSEPIAAGQAGDLPPLSLQAVFHAAGHIEAMGKQAWRRPPKKGRP